MLFIIGESQSFSNAFEGSTTQPGEIAASFYNGIFSYAGWNYLNFMTEELRNPFVLVAIRILDLS